jgi:hypothetical protein
MASLADAPDLVGFFSYSREDDDGSGEKEDKVIVQAAGTRPRGREPPCGAACPARRNRNPAPTQ